MRVRVREEKPYFVVDDYNMQHVLNTTAPANLANGRVVYNKTALNGMEVSIDAPAHFDEADTDAWLDGVIKAASDAKMGLQKLTKEVRNNTASPRYVKTPEGLSVPFAIYQFLGSLSHPFDEMSVKVGINQSTSSTVETVNGPTGKKLTSRDELLEEIKMVGKQTPSINFAIKSILELDNKSFLSGNLIGARGFVLISEITADYRMKNKMSIDIMWIVRDPTNEGEWVVTRWTHSGALQTLLPGGGGTDTTTSTTISTAM